MRVQKGQKLNKALILRDPIAQASGKENDGMIYNEARVRDYVVPGYQRKCKVMLESVPEGVSFDSGTLQLTWDTGKAEVGVYTLPFIIEDECMRDIQEVQIEIF